MRLPLVLAALTISVPAASEAPAPSAPPADTAVAMSAVVRSNQPKADECRPTRAHFADVGSAWRGEPLRPKKLDELPPATTYMTVYRTIDGCEAPMTMVEYRTAPRR